MGQDNNNMNQNDQTRRPAQQENQGQQQQPNQQNQQGQNRDAGQQSGQRIDTDGDGRTRDPNDTRPTDDGGRGKPVER